MPAHSLDETNGPDPTPWLQFVQLTIDMLTAVQEEDWDRLVHAESLRAALLPTLAKPGVVDPDAATLHALQQADEHVLFGAHARMREISDFLGERQLGRRMRQAYDGQA